MGLDRSLTVEEMVSAGGIFSGRMPSREKLAAMLSELDRLMLAVPSQWRKKALIGTRRGGVADYPGRIEFEGVKGKDFERLAQAVGAGWEHWRCDPDGEDVSRGYVYLHKFEAAEKWSARVRAAVEALAGEEPACFAAQLWLSFGTGLERSSVRRVAVVGAGDAQGKIAEAYARWMVWLLGVDPLPGCSWGLGMGGEGGIWPGYPPSRCLDGIESSDRLTQKEDGRIWHASAHVFQAPAKAGHGLDIDEATDRFAQCCALSGLEVVDNALLGSGASGDKKILCDSGLAPLLGALLDAAEIGSSAPAASGPGKRSL